MKIRLNVKTPPGKAPTTEYQLRPFIIGKIKEVPTTWTSKEKNEFYWELEVPLRKYFKIVRNVSLFQSLVQGTLDQIEKRKWIKKMTNTTGETIQDTRKLMEETTVTVIKQATADEITEGTETKWERIKRTFNKK